jgi:haloalkane dehalogenase
MASAPIEPGNEVLRTPDERFERLPGYPFEPRYMEIDGDELGPLRVHYVDEGPRDAAPVLLVHGQPTWSYLYRTVIAGLVARGLRVVAPDNVGYGRSDKPADRFAYTYERHVEWHRRFVEQLDLRRVTVVGQDWGGPIGFGALAAMPDRYDRAVATNTILHCADPSFAGRLAWANHGIEDGRVVVAERLLDHIVSSQRTPHIDVRAAIARAAERALSPEELGAYAAPFPDDRFMAGVRQMNVLIPVTRTDPGAAVSRRTWDALARWDKPFLTAFSDDDPGTRGFEALFRERVPGAAGIRHVTIAGSRHFVQEDRGAELAQAIADFIEATPGP